MYNYTYMEYWDIFGKFYDFKTMKITSNYRNQLQWPFLYILRSSFGVLNCIWGEVSHFHLYRLCRTSTITYTLLNPLAKQFFAASGVRFPGQNVINKRIKNACKWATEQDVARTWTCPWICECEPEPENRRTNPNHNLEYGLPRRLEWTN